MITVATVITVPRPNLGVCVVVCGIDGVGCDARAMPADQDQEARDRHVRALFFSSLGLLSHESTRAFVQGTAAHDQAASKRKLADKGTLSET